MTEAEAPNRPAASPGVADRQAGFREEQPLGPAERLREAMRLRGYDTVAALARAMGTSDNRIHQQLKRNSLSKTDAPRYAAFLRVGLLWLLEGRGPMEAPAAAEHVFDPAAGSGGIAAEIARRVESVSGASARVAVHSAAAPAGGEFQNIGGDTPYAKLIGERDLPVYGVAQGGPGALVVTPEPIEFVKRPAPLMGVAGGFAVYVTGDSMSPAYDQGDLILIHPARPIERGLDALLVNAPPAGGDWTAIVKRVEGWTDKVWKLAQFNPKKSFELPRSEFPRAYRIVGKYNRR